MYRFDESGHGSPVPMLFSSDPKGARDRLVENHQQAYDMLHLLVSRLLSREELTLEEAMEYVANPRKGVVQRPLAAKFKPRTDVGAAAASTNDSKGQWNDFCSKQYCLELSLASQLSRGMISKLWQHKPKLNRVRK